MKDHLSYIVGGLSPFKPLDKKKLLYRKQLIYAGDFVKKDDYDFEVTDDTIEGWADTGNEMIENGIDIPFFKEHTVDPDDRRAKVVKFFTGVDAKGRKSLYADLEFADEKAAQKALPNNVSIYADAEFKDGSGRVWEWPITHVAITSFPVIPSLEPYTAIAASLLKGKKMPSLKPTPKKNANKLDKTLEQLGLKAPKGADDKTKRAMIKDALKDVLPGDDEEDEDEELLEDDEEFEDDDDEVLKIENKGKKGKKQQKIAASLSPVILKQVSKARKTELEQLVRDFKITPAVRDNLVKKYCTDEKISLALSHKTGDDFDDIVTALALNQPYKKGEKTGAQVGISLSHDNAEGENKLIQDAKARAEKAAARR
jgi:hypothetical protein